ncbi:hypothetical protein RCL_jg6960.t1 [Rhizophagus clarus]|uniref:Uncharacterized protein n=1 Tax=Rhizophagus clarus TaxID=94130 RepID=A0A8H3QM96_9GLOM|nr:hypothetical protein RCL_jg6960.t1 [Rhizophagus clarus]
MTKNSTAVIRVQVLSQISVSMQLKLAVQASIIDDVILNVPDDNNYFSNSEPKSKKTRKKVWLKPDTLSIFLRNPTIAEIVLQEIKIKTEMPALVFDWNDA